MIRKNKVAKIHSDGKVWDKVVKRTLPRGRPFDRFYAQPRESLGYGNFKYPKYGGCL